MFVGIQAIFFLHDGKAWQNRICRQDMELVVASGSTMDKHYGGMWVIRNVWLLQVSSNAMCVCVN